MNKQVMLGATMRLIGMIGAPGAEAGDPDFTFMNQSGNYVYELYISPNWYPDWGPDVLGYDILAPYDYLDIDMIGYGSTECYFDIKVVTDAGWVTEYWDVDLCSVYQVIYPFSEASW